MPEFHLKAGPVYCYAEKNSTILPSSGNGDCQYSLWVLKERWSSWFGLSGWLNTVGHPSRYWPGSTYGNFVDVPLSHVATANCRTGQLRAGSQRAKETCGCRLKCTWWRQTRHRTGLPIDRNCCLMKLELHYRPDRRRCGRSRRYHRQSNCARFCRRGQRRRIGVFSFVSPSSWCLRSSLTSNQLSPGTVTRRRWAISAVWTTEACRLKNGSVMDS